MRFIFILVLLWPSWSWGETVQVAVTASFKHPLEQLAPLFTKQSGHTLVISSGSSGKLVAQIQNGAPYQVFLAADETFPDQLILSGQAPVESRFIYALGRLVLYVLQPERLPEGSQTLANGKIKRLALANPDTAPYGRAAKEVLTGLHLWDAFAGRMAIGENVGQVLAFVHSGAVDAGFVAYSQLLDHNRRLISGGFWEPPTTRYAPLRHAGVILQRGLGKVGVTTLVAFLTSVQVRTELVRMGFGIPP